MKKLFAALAILSLLVGIPVLAAGGKVALLRADGTVKVDGKPAKKLQPLLEGSTLEVAQGASVRVDFLKSGKRQTVQGPASLKVAATGLSGQGKIVDQKAATLAAMKDIGAQKKMGGGAVRNLFFPVCSRPSSGGERLTFSAEDSRGKPYSDSYFVRLYVPGGADLWESEELQGPTYTVPAEVGASLKPGEVYAVMTYTKDDYYIERAGHALPFMSLSDQEVATLAATRESLEALARESKDPAPLLLLMEILDEKVQINAASEVACEAYTMSQALNAEERRQLLETAHRLTLDANRADLNAKLPDLTEK